MAVRGSMFRSLASSSSVMLGRPSVSIRSASSVSATPIFGRSRCCRRLNLDDKQSTVHVDSRPKNPTSRRREWFTSRGRSRAARRPAIDSPPEVPRRQGRHDLSHGQHGVRSPSARPVSLSRPRTRRPESSQRRAHSPAPGPGTRRCGSHVVQCACVRCCRLPAAWTWADFALSRWPGSRPCWRQCSEAPAVMTRLSRRTCGSSRKAARGCPQTRWQGRSTTPRWVIESARECRCMIAGELRMQPLSQRSRFSSKTDLNSRAQLSRT
jgi:hypothetical protein